MRYLLLNLLLIWPAGTLVATVRVVPTPQYFEPNSQSLVMAHGAPVGIVVGPAPSAGSEKLKLAANFLQRDLKQADSSLQLNVEALGRETSGSRIYLWDYGADSNPPVDLNSLDRQVLTDPQHYGQSYVIRTPDEKSVWVVGGTDEGVLLGTMSVLQLIQKTAGGIGIAGAYIRDYPDFRYRSEDWLLNSEINRWALDRGQGVEAYKRLCERKLDEALRFKINMVFFDGFGWGLKQRFAGYGALMRSLNQYARARGIRLLYGGYGASYGITYQTGPLYEEGGYMGEVFKNREWYPNGPTYECMGFPGPRRGSIPESRAVAGPTMRSIT